MTNPIKTTASVGAGASVNYVPNSITVAGATAGIKAEYKNLYVAAKATGGYGVAGSVEAGYNPTVFQTKSGNVKFGVNVAAGADITYGRLNGGGITEERNRKFNITNNADDVLTANVNRSNCGSIIANIAPKDNIELKYNEKGTLYSQLVYDLHAKAGLTATIYDKAKVEVGALFANVRSPEKELLPAVTTKINYTDPLDNSQHELKTFDDKVVTGNNSMGVSPYAKLTVDLGKGISLNFEGSCLRTEIGLSYIF